MPQLMFQVSSTTTSRPRGEFNLQLSLYVALKGIGAHLLKAGSKRKRKQADIVGQNEEQEVALI